MPGVKYRPEVDGLRALAVVPVVLFHANVPGFSGGFIGVDVFFVISGFLITSIILAERAAGKFSLTGFYERRARRILPALLFVVTLCVPFAWLWMLPDDLENFGQSIVATLLFSNNILLTLTTGYWDLAGEFKPLLHTWSLGVEEQFYLMYPLLLIVVLRRLPNSLLPILAACGVFSLALFLLPHLASLDGKATAAVFYNLPSRGWQLLAGGIAALMLRDITARASQTLGNAMSWAGLALITVALFVPMSENLGVTVRALLATAGTFLLLAFAGPNHHPGRLLASRLPVAVGLISYSVYLLHQPLIALTRVYLPEEPGSLLAIPVAATFLGAAVSYRYVEKPFRNPQRTSRRFVALTLGAVGCILMAFGLAAHKTAGFPGRLGAEAGENANLSDISIAYSNRAKAYIADSFPAGEGRRVLVLGNSFGRDMVNILLEADPDRRLRIVYRDDHYDCFNQNDEPALDRLLTDADLVLMASSELPHPSCVQADIQEVVSRGGRIVYVGTKNFGHNLNWIVRVPKAQRGSLWNQIPREAIEHELEMARLVPEENFLSLLSFSVKSGRVQITSQDGAILSPDRSHLTRAGAIFYSKLHPVRELVGTLVGFTDEPQRSRK